MQSWPSLPQDATAAQRLQRAEELRSARETYALNTGSNIAPLPVAEKLPKTDMPTLVWLDAAGTLALELLGNLLVKLSKLTKGGLVELIEQEERGLERAVVGAALGELVDLHQDLSRTLSKRPMPSAPKKVSGLKGLLEAVEDKVEAKVHQLLDPDQSSFLEELVELLGRALKLLLSETIKTLLQYLGLYGTARQIDDFEQLFQNIRLPNVGSNYQTDTMFAWMRVGGPNPMVIQQLRQANPRFPVTEEDYQKALRHQGLPEDSLDAALQEGRLYIADYSGLAGVPMGTVDGLPKYMATGYALYTVPPGQKRLAPVAIQLGAEPGHQNPVIPCSDSMQWKLAKSQIQTVDGNWHEAVSHLGQTHLVIEVSALATHRHLPPQHPLYVLMLPHIEGSLFINNAAVTTLIKPGGVVDKILSPTIQASTALAVQSVTGYQFEKMWVPNELASRGVENPAKLPDYPYRDDAMLLWSVIHTWVEGYLGVYYNGDEAVQKDSELMEWANEIAASIPSFGPVTTFDYLVNAVTHFLFTGSAQHAAVNFQQSFLMSFAPSMPLAAYIPPNSGFDQQDYLKQLPPLQNAVLQQAVGLLLGGVYYTRLGDYDRYRGSSYFQDPRISGALGRFHAELRAAEKEIGRRNLDRIPYTLLLPSSIPQSINI